MPTNQTYTLTTLADVLHVVNADNLEALLTDLRGLLANAAITKALYEAAHPDKPFNMFEGVSVEWTDDNVNRQSILAKVREGESLEFVTSGPAHGAKKRRKSPKNA